MGVTQTQIWLHIPGKFLIHYFRTKLCLTSRRLFLITFTKKSCMHSETYIAYLLHCDCTREKCFLEGIFCLSVENVMCVFDLFFFISNHGVGRLLRYMMSDVIFGKTGFALFKSYWNLKVVRCTKFVTDQETLGGRVPQFSIQYTWSFRDIFVK